MVRPSVPAGTRNVEAPRWTGTSGSVIATTMKNEATDALEEKYFRPVITQSPPSRKARVLNTRGSAPPCGSVIEKHEKISPDSSPAR
jgi:hypothetical protein